MRTLTRRTILVTGAAALALLVAACGTGNDTDQPNNPPTAEPSAQPTTTSEELESAIADLETRITDLDLELATATETNEQLVVERDKALFTLEVVRDQVEDWKERFKVASAKLDASLRAADTDKTEEAVAETTTTTTIPNSQKGKSDGFYTVGTEISPGTWESQGNGDSCYWAVLDSNQEIIKNNFGNAGGRVKISETADEFETSGCGVWTFQG